MVEDGREQNLNKAGTHPNASSNTDDTASAIYNGGLTSQSIPISENKYQLLSSLLVLYSQWQS